jgi:hypothetical protein
MEYVRSMEAQSRTVRVLGCHVADGSTDPICPVSASTVDVGLYAVPFRLLSLRSLGLRLVDSRSSMPGEFSFCTPRCVSDRLPSPNNLPGINMYCRRRWLRSAIYASRVCHRVGRCPDSRGSVKQALGIVSLDAPREFQYSGMQRFGHLSSSSMVAGVSALPVPSLLTEALGCLLPLLKRFRPNKV